MSRAHDDTDGNAAYGKKPFKRARSHFADRITADGKDGWPVEAGRYRLVVSRACPWASRALVSRRLLGLEGAVSLAVADPVQDDRSWRFTLDPGGRDPVLGIRYLSEAYEAREPDYPDGVSVPAIVDVPSGRLVTNDYQRITLDFATEWTALHRPGAPDLYPEPLRAEIDEVMEGVYRDVNNGVYRAGFATRQSEYEDACRDVFRRLDLVAQRLADHRYLVGDTITEADIRLFTTLVRFDAVYHGHFKCNRWKLTENPVLWAYARDLYQTPGFGDTVDFDHIKRHYYQVHTGINPTAIVPLGPDLSGWVTPHHREELGGRPFGDGTPPAPRGGASGCCPAAEGLREGAGRRRKGPAPPGRTHEVPPVPEPACERADEGKRACDREPSGRFHECRSLDAARLRRGLGGGDTRRGGRRARTAGPRPPESAAGGTARGASLGLLGRCRLPRPAGGPDARPGVPR